MGLVVRCRLFLVHFLLTSAPRTWRALEEGSLPLLIALWSATGGSGTSVLTAACAMVLARTHDERRAAGVRVADLAGDLAAVFGLAADADLGLADWLDAGIEAPTDALDRLATEVAPGVVLLPRGGSRRLTTALPEPESGAALATALAASPSPVLVDCGLAREPAQQAVVEVADVAVLVLRSCYLALRRAVHSPSLPHTAGIVLLDESGRSLSFGQIADVLDLPVLARVPVKPAIARAVDAGVLPTRMPEALARAAGDLVRRTGATSGRRGEAA